MGKFASRLVAGLVAAFVLVGCSSVENAVLGQGTVFCSVRSGGVETSCIVSRNFPTSEQSTIQNECTSSGGTVTGSCPTASLVGCCTQAESAAGPSAEVETCYYAGTASQLKTQCGANTWTTNP